MICPHCNNRLPEGMQVCFRCGKPLYAAAITQPQPTPPPIIQPTPTPRPKGMGKAVAAIVILLVLLVGSAAGGHYMGWYTLPLLPEKPESKPAAAVISASGAIESEVTASAGQSVDESVEHSVDDPQRGQMEVLYDLSHVKISVDSKNPAHAVIDMQGFDLPDWVFEEPPPPEGDPTGIEWTVFFSSDGKNLYSIVGTRWQGTNNEHFDRTDYAILDMINYYTDNEYNARTGTGPGTGMPYGITQVSRDSITWELTLEGNELLDMNNLAFIGYQVEEYNVRSPQYASFGLQNGSWADLGDIPLPEYFKAMHDGSAVSALSESAESAAAEPASEQSGAYDAKQVEISALQAMLEELRAREAAARERGESKLAGEIQKDIEQLEAKIKEIG